MDQRFTRGPARGAFHDKGDGPTMATDEVSNRNSAPSNELYILHRRSTGD
jgi:hypothetical protein